MTFVFVCDANVTKELKIDVKSASVADLYCAVAKLLYDRLENPRKHLSLLFTDKELTFSKKKISCCGVVNGSTVGVVLCLPDGYQATHGANGVAVATGTTTQTGTRELQMETTTAERVEVASEKENHDNNGILRMTVNDEGREEEKKKKKKKKKRKTKNNQSEPENDGMRKNSKEFNEGEEEEEDENMEKISIGHLIEETEGRENEKDSQEKIAKKKRKKKNTKRAEETKEDRAEEEVDRPQLLSLPGIEITDEKDSICEIGPSAKLPCGHLISSESMRGHCEAELAKGKTAIQCATCSVDLEYRIVRGIACFTPGEMHSVENAILYLTLGKNRDVFPCSNCRVWTKAIDKEASCLKCFCLSERTGRRFIFCRNCFEEWENPSHSSCANLRCKSYIESTLEILRRSPIIFPGNHPVFLLWAIYQHRVCPRCGLLSEFLDGCTQVHCEYCGYFYCFVCLSGAESKEGLKCRPYFSGCALAPVQTEIPVWTRK